MDFLDDLTRRVRYGIVWRNRTRPPVDGQSADHRRSHRRSAAGTPNPWLASAQEEPLDELVDVAPAPRTPARLEPQPGLKPPRAEARLSRVTVAHSTGRVWWVGAHGGAGESTLEQLLEGSRAAGHAWPLALPSAHVARPAVALVARTHARGLRAAQAAATEWATGEIPVNLLGLVLIADAPGRMPRPLRDLERLVRGGVPATWHLPWHEPWRLGEPIDAASAPFAAHTLLAAITDLTPMPSELRPVEAGPALKSPPTTHLPHKGAARA